MNEIDALLKGLHCPLYYARAYLAGSSLQAARGFSPEPDLGHPTSRTMRNTFQPFLSWSYSVTAAQTNSKTPIKAKGTCSDWEEMDCTSRTNLPAQAFPLRKSVPRTGTEATTPGGCRRHRGKFQALPPPSLGGCKIRRFSHTLDSRTLLGGLTQRCPCQRGALALPLSQVTQLGTQILTLGQMLGSKPHVSNPTNGE